MIRLEYKTDKNLKARIQLHRRFSTNKYSWKKWIFDHLLMPGSGVALELGCGTGDLWTENMDRIPDDWRLSLSDFSPELLRSAKRNLRSSTHRFSFELINSQSIPRRDESCDAMIANHMLYHLSDAAKSIQEIARVLKPRGKLYASTIGLNHMEELFRIKPLPGASADEWRENIFTLENGKRLLKRRFSKVNLYFYEDSLRVTEIDLLRAYIDSIQNLELVENKDRLIKRIDAEIRNEGYFKISKNMGLFEATKGA